MLEVRRCKLLGVILTSAVLLTCSQVWSDPRPARDLKESRSSKEVVDKFTASRADDQGFNRFGDQPVGLYQTTTGETLFWWQVKPQLQDVPRRPLDVLLLVDTAASKAQGPLAQAQLIAKSLIAKLGANDRLALWTANVQVHNLSRGFQPAGKLADALAKLDQEYPSGAVNLKDGLQQTLASFADQPGRQKLILFLGSGTSIAGPLDGASRAAWCAEAAKRQVAFFVVPLGLQLDPLNLHGLVNGTGGKLVRLDPRQTADTVVPALLKAFAAPILYPAKVQLPEAVVEALPAELPPLRRDAATLVVGKLKPGAARFEAWLSGTLAGQEVRLKIEQPLPKADIDNFFLSSMVKQWREQKERPALMQADRALAYAADQLQLARADLLAKAEWALDENKLDPAWKLFKQAEQLDPHSQEAKAGLNLVQKLRDGTVKREDLQREFSDENRKKDLLVRVENGQVVRRPREELQPQNGKADAGAVNAADPLANPDNPNDIMKEAKARQAVADQQARVLVDEALRRGNRMVLTSPDDAHDFLKRTLESVRNNPDISPKAKTALSLRLEQNLRGVDRLGARVKRDQTERLALEAVRSARSISEGLAKANEERIRERLRVYHNLMNQARADLAYQQAEAIRSDLVNQGKPVPQAVTAAYQSGLVAYHVREIQNMRRDREERWLRTLLQVERSSKPFPDEPPIEFPTPAAIKAFTRDFDNWADFSKYRIGRYSLRTFGAELPRRALELRDMLGSVVNFAGFDDPKTTLAEAIDQLQKRYDLTIDVNEKAFKAEGVMDVMKTEIAQPNPIPPLRASLGTVLKKILSRITTTSGATYIIRREAIEITTGQYAIGEKTLRVYPAAQLVMPIPMPGQFIQQQMINQTGMLGVFGGFGMMGMMGMMGGMGGMGYLGGGLGMMGGGLGMLGGGLGALGALGAGGLGALGALGGGLGALGALGGGLGALGGGLGMGGLGMGGMGMGGMGMMGMGGMGMGGMGGMGMMGMGGGMGMVGMGGFSGNFRGTGAGMIGGGRMGFQGGFGLQNNNQSLTLMNLIRQVVGQPKDWLPQFDPITGQPINPLDQGNPGGMDPAVLGGDNNQLGFYPPALALVVKGTSRIHSRFESPLYSNQPGMGPGGMGFNDKVIKDALAKNDKNKDPRNKVGGDAAQRDPKMIWQDALARGVDNPGLIVAVADYLALNLKWEHAAEFLKANLRQGIVVKPWVYESLAIALRESGGSAEEVERAEVSSAELSPGDASTFLKAAQALGNHKRYDRAVAFCRQAANLEPNLARPYAEALLYAELGQDSQAMTWAAGNLLRKDWPYQNRELQSQALQKLESLARTLEKKNRADEARKLRASVQSERERDLVIKLAWQGEADLDLVVKGPTGSVCSALNRQTIGGGILVGDSLADMTTETFLDAQAFPGAYRIAVKCVWGKPLGNKAQLRIIRHQGTPDEFEEIRTVNLPSKEPVVFALDRGRRTETAYVPPPAAAREANGPVEVAPEKPDRILNQLRLMADPEVTSVDRGFHGSTSSAGMPAVSMRPIKVPERKPEDQMLLQNRVRSFVRNSVDVTAEAVLSADRRTVRISLTPVFNTPIAPTAPVVNNPLIPGGR